MKKKGSLLVVEDDRLTLESLIFSFTGEIGGATDVYGARTVNRALEVVRSSEPEVVVLDLSLEDDGGVAGGLKLLGIIKEQLPLCRVIVCTGCEEALYGGECLLKGAAHFVSKPVEMGILITLVRDSFYQVELHRIRKSREGTSSSCIIGSSAQARRLEESLIFAASIPHSVLLIGETGVGKSYCAKIIHEESNRASYPFIKYLTGMQSADLAGSALFGHKKGAFTGATEDRLGAFGQAGQGTLLIDDIDLLPVDIQGLLLGVLDDNEYTPIGGTKREGLECRIVTATNRDIEALLTSQLLRKDFYYRVSQLIVSIPPLRERREDIPEIARAFLGTLSEELSDISLSESALVRLETFSWPGNLRQLQFVLREAAYKVVQSGRSFITAADLSLVHERRMEGEKSLGKQVQRFKEELVKDALDKYGSQVKAAKELGIDRGTLRRILGKGKGYSI